jgi:hypothetical protein
MATNNKWQNNIISRRLNEEYSTDFCICDIDGVCRKEYYDTSSSERKRRFVVYESKHWNERVSQTQLESLYLFSTCVKWSEFDSYSGVFVFVGLDSRFEKFSVKKIVQVIDEAKKVSYDLEDHPYGTITLDQFVDWIRAYKDRYNAKPIEQIRKSIKAA